jgi:hypothetical protein
MGGAVQPGVRCKCAYHHRWRKCTILPAQRHMHRTKPSSTVQCGCHLGSTLLTTCGTGCGTAGTLVARQLYDAWGNVRSGGGLLTDIAFTGQRSDASTNLLYFKARYYSSC